MIDIGVGVVVGVICLAMFVLIGMQIITGHLQEMKDKEIKLEILKRQRSVKEE